MNKFKNIIKHDDKRALYQKVKALELETASTDMKLRQWEFEFNRLFIELADTYINQMRQNIAGCKIKCRESLEKAVISDSECKELMERISTAETIVDNIQTDSAEIKTEIETNLIGYFDSNPIADRYIPHVKDVVRATFDLWITNHVPYEKVADRYAKRDEVVEVISYSILKAYGIPSDAVVIRETRNLLKADFMRDDTYAEMAFAKTCVPASV